MRVIVLFLLFLTSIYPVIKICYCSSFSGAVWSSSSKHPTAVQSICDQFPSASYIFYSCSTRIRLLVKMGRFYLFYFMCYLTTHSTHF